MYFYCVFNFSRNDVIMRGEFQD